MTAALPAFLLESVFYLGSVFGETREWFATVVPRRAQAPLLWFSALLPYLVFAVLAGNFDRHAFAVIAVLSGVVAFWHAVFPRRVAYDAGFLAVVAAPVVLRVFGRLYLSPQHGFKVDVLGHLMWIRLAIAALFLMRGWDPGGFGFWPRGREWRTGLLYYGVAVIPIAGVALAIHDVRFGLVHGPWWRTLGLAVGTFFAMLWVVALGEELFFRGVIERALLRVWSSPIPAVLLSAVVFGSVHLWFVHFPNWQRAVVASMLGLACGIAYAQTGSVRVPMVTHALVVTTWRVFFNGK